jgi:hypothetical protein
VDSGGVGVLGFDHLRRKSAHAIRSLSTEEIAPTEATIAKKTITGSPSNK